MASFTVISALFRSYDYSSAASSPLSSLSSLPDEDARDASSLGSPVGTFDFDEIRAALVSLYCHLALDDSFLMHLPVIMRNASATCSVSDHHC